MKNKNTGGRGDCQLNLIGKKGTNTKMRKKLSNIEIFFSLVSLPRHFTKFIFLEQLTAMPEFNIQNMLLFFFVLFLFFFFLSSHHDTNPLLHLYHFRKKYDYILANINSESSKVRFSFFCLHPMGQTFFVRRSGGAMVLGKFPVPGYRTILITVEHGPIALAVGAGGSGLDIFTLIYPFSSFSVSLGDDPI